MDQLLAQRFEIYESMGDVDPRVVPLLRQAVRDLSTELSVPATDENFGMLVSHFVAALGRALRDEAETDAPTASALADIQANAPDALQQAEQFASEVNEALDVEVTDGEIAFLALHLGTLRLKTKRPATGQKAAE